MFILRQDRKRISNSFSMDHIDRTDDNKIIGVYKSGEIDVLGEYENEMDAKAVVKLFFADARRREPAFKMPKKDEVAKMLKIAAERAAAAKKAAIEKEARRQAQAKHEAEKKAAQEKKEAEKAAAAAAKAAKAAEKAAKAAAAKEATEE